MQDRGLISVPSGATFAETMERLLRAIADSGLTVFADVDHAAGAADVGMVLRPTRLVMYGNPRGGTPLMLDHQSCGIDLPIKILVFEDADGRAWLTYNDARWIARRHGLTEQTMPAVDAIAAGMAQLVSVVTA